MTTLEIALLVYIVLGQIWFVVFVNVSGKRYRNYWFVFLTWILQPISVTFLGIQYLLIDWKSNKKENK